MNEIEAEHQRYEEIKRRLEEKIEREKTPMNDLYKFHADKPEDYVWAILGILLIIFILVAGFQGLFAS